MYTRRNDETSVLKNALTMFTWFFFLKTTPTFETVDQNYVTSDAFDGSCGIELSVGTVYYMTGQIFFIKLHNLFMVVA